MQTGPSRRISVTVKHPTPLIANGVVAALSRETHIDATEWDGKSPPGDLLLADCETAIQLARHRGAGHAQLQSTRLAAIGTLGKQAEVQAVLEAGIDGYVPGVCSVAELVACVRTVAAGGRYLSEDAVHSVVSSLSQQRLTRKELVVLRCLWEGMSNKAIARHLQIEVGTVKSHVKAILHKLDACNRTQAAKLAVARGLLA